MMSLCLIITGDINLDHLVVGATAEFLYHKGLFSLSLISVLWGDTVRLCKYPVSHHTSLTNLVSMDGSCLQQLLLWLYPVGNLLFLSFLLHLFIGIPL